jgi:hypothetical protein
MATSTAATPVCTESGLVPICALRQIDVRQQAPGCLFGIRDGSLPEFGGEGGQHVWRAGRQSGCCVLGELVEQAWQRWVTYRCWAQFITPLDLTSPLANAA